ncbi:unnamed protein product [Cylindrotheca closterium]|uniref:Uncharacterized protein n=1 Tax=Cylindrotheca closterium TaxID=2856 RepID=A0AAD2FJ23_9STRA|nr:unnamed protein product [Cylindrotheca closterium]
MRRRLGLQFVLLIALLLVIRQAFSQEDDYENPAKANATSTGTPNITLPGTLNTTLRPTSSPLLTKAPSKTNAAQDPTPCPTAAPFLLIRPLRNMKVSLFGAYDSSRNDELLILLKSLLEQSLYDAMAKYFVPESDKNEFTTEQDLSNLSILSKVTLEWTTTMFTFDGDPYHSSLQASGTLAFTSYDYFLLHPQTILSLQEQAMAGNATTNHRIDLNHMDWLLEQKNLPLQVGQFIMVEAGEDAPTAAPTTWNLDDDDDIISNVTTDLKDDNIRNNRDDFDETGYTYGPPKSVSKETIRAVLIVACTLSALAFGLFSRFVAIKSKQIKKDRMVCKQSFAKKEGVQDENNSEASNGDFKATGIGMSPMTDKSVSSGSRTQVPSPNDTMSVSSFSDDSVSITNEEDPEAYEVFVEENSGDETDVIEIGRC